MPVCTFFGHRDCPDTIKPQLREVLMDLITNHGVTVFYVGHQGRFDAIVRGVLGQLQKENPRISYAVVLSRLPREADGDDTMLPEGIESVHPRYRIGWRNKWMLRQSDFVVAYVTHDWGGAAQFVRSAAGQGKRVIRLK